MGRLTKIILATVVIIPMLVVAGVILALPRLNLAGLVAGRATATLGRIVAIDSVRVSPGRGPRRRDTRRAARQHPGWRRSSHGDAG